MGRSQKSPDENGRMRRGVVMVKQPGLFSPEFVATSSHNFTQSQQQKVAVELGIHILACWEKFFVLPQLLYRWRHQSGIPSRVPLLSHMRKHDFTICNLYNVCQSVFNPFMKMVRGSLSEMSYTFHVKGGQH
jgi:hypothetical protein